MKYFTVIFFLLSAFAIFSPYIPPVLFWPAALVVFTIPFAIVANLILTVYFAVGKSWYFVLPMLMVVAGLGLTWPIFPASTFLKKNEPAPYDFRVLSFNASFFRAENVFSEEYYDMESNPSALNIREWVVSNNADIICIQEFFDDENSPVLNNVETISNNGGYAHYFLTKPMHDNGTRRGLITFSKFPIVDKGEVFLSKNKFNGASFTDVLVGTDTIRVINLHLESFQYGGGGIGTLLRKFKKTVITRGLQFEGAYNFINSSPYKLVVCGDFNEVPYSYIYRKINKGLVNAFEATGTGLQPTVNSDVIPLPIRIDNQFYSPPLETSHFKTYSDFKFSDHYPIEASYIIR